MASIPYSTSTNPYTLTGTTITETSTNMNALAVRVHRQSVDSRQSAELWYYRDSAWNQLTQYKATFGHTAPIRLSYDPNKPTLCELQFWDNDGDLTIENLGSAINKNGSNAYDPLLKINRKMLLRLGVMCFTNLASGLTATASTAVTSGALANLTDGTFADFTGTPTDIAKWTTSGAGTVTLTYDLGASYAIRHVVARFGTKIGTYTLPTSVLVEISADNSTWVTKKPVRPISADYDDSYDGQAIEAVVCDLDQHGLSPNARYVRFTITVSGAQTFVLDQIAIYGGASYSWYGRNLFTGYIGNETEIDAEGRVRLTLTDALKKLGDNYLPLLTAAYTNNNSSSTANDLYDIATSLLTSTAYWGRGSSDGYDSPVDTSLIGWYGTKSGLIYPRWQGMGNSILAYLTDLIKSLGYLLYADGNGVYQLAPTLSTTLIPDRLFIRDSDGNLDFGNFRRISSSAYLRNSVRVTTGTVQTGAAAITLKDATSIANYGTLQTNITDSVLAGSPALLQNMAATFIKNYANRYCIANVGNINPDFDTQLYRVHGFRATGGRLFVAPKATATCKGELWQLNTLVHEISAQYWVAKNVEVTPYFAGGQDPPFMTQLSSPTATSLRATFTAITNPKVTSIQMWVSTAFANPAFPYTLATTLSNTGNPTTIDATGLTTSTRYYVYLVAVDYRGASSTQSGTLSCVTGGSVVDNSGWTVTDLSCNLTGSARDTVSGMTTLRFAMTWTSPPGNPPGVTDPANGGTKRFRIWMNAQAPPVSPTIASNWTYTNDGWEWHGDYVPPGMTWDRYTPGSLTWTVSMTFPTTDWDVLGTPTITRSVTGITRSGTTATATLANHGLQIGDTPTIAGAAQSQYNGVVTITGTPTTDTFTYNVSGSPATPATGTITCTSRQRVYFKMWTTNKTTEWDIWYGSNTVYWTF